MLKPAGFFARTVLSAKFTAPEVVNAPAWIDARSEDVPLTATLPGVWSATLIFGSIVVPAEKERSLLVEPDAPSTLMVRSQSVHPNSVGQFCYAEALEDAL
jgi:hypothetical protein